MGSETSESNRLRRLHEPLENIPEPFPTRRENRGESERRGRHLEALRHRLDALVRAEVRLGDEQQNVHRSRAERNALVWVLQRFAADPSAPAQPAGARRGPVQYAADILAECESLAQDGYTQPDERPGLLRHRTDAAAPVEVPLAIWFYFRGRADNVLPYTVSATRSGAE